LKKQKFRSANYGAIKMRSYQKILQENMFEPQRDDIMKCEICGRLADALNEGKGPLICCGQRMIKVGEAIDRHPSGTISRARNYYDETV